MPPRTLLVATALLALVVLLPSGQAELSVDQRVFAFEGPRVVVVFTNGTISGEDARTLRETYDTDMNGTIEPEEAERAEQDVRAIAQEGGEGARFDAAPVARREVLEARFENLEGSVESDAPLLLHVTTRLSADPAADAAPDAWAFEHAAPADETNATWVFLAPQEYRVGNVSGLVEPARIDAERNVQGRPSPGGNVTVTFARDARDAGSAGGQEQEQEVAQPEDAGDEGAPAPGVALLAATLLLAALARRTAAGLSPPRRGR